MSDHNGESRDEVRVHEQAWPERHVEDRFYASVHIPGVIDGSEPIVTARGTSEAEARQAVLKKLRDLRDRIDRLLFKEN
jgi:hypothetical protein